MIFILTLVREYATFPDKGYCFTQATKPDLQEEPYLGVKNQRREDDHRNEQYEDKQKQLSSTGLQCMADHLHSTHGPKKPE